MDQPPLTTRMFWTWDHSTAWVLNRPGAQTMGASNHYMRDPQLFVADYTRLLTWCGKHGMDAVVVWGLLRDTHGGVESANRLCDVAAENGVRLLCGAELKCLVLENYGSATNPEAEVGIFLRDVAAFLLGGESHARDYLKYARLKGDADRVPDVLTDIYRRIGQLPTDAARRWTCLANFLASTVYGNA